MRAWTRIGFGLENYDATGVWRTLDGESPVDSSGTLTSGESFRGATQLKGILKSKKTEFATALSAKLLTYALGRGLRVRQVRGARHHPIANPK